MLVKVKLTRQSGRAMLSIDASELHAYLDTHGVPLDADGVRYINRPAADYSEIDTRRNQISSALLLRRGPQQVNVGDCYGRPVGVDLLQTLANSVEEVVRNVVDHYRPIEINVVIAGKAGA